ncbi:WbuC family cupin fold metalloprotein [Leptospira weilii]|uniref:WbuC family cupin fold metalloprotein n=1 Tax=Leptospira weilii TaxID=28184 RepID=UPI001EF3BB5C|nr:WbuC family cupin fold metalloprotein [Leptospira weilii]MCL8266140.1 WbuC family cupin fold metalloprotein [Leptospira weilii]ULH28616.1 WbuC family cupin fold metalloprotein [Leptospira weilii]
MREILAQPVSHILLSIVNPNLNFSKPYRQLLTDSLFSEVLQKANASPRKRANHNFHELSEVYQRFLNVLTRDTYIQAHRHKSPPKPETFLVLKGSLGFILFHEDGSIRETHYLNSDGPVYGIDIAPGVYHTLVCLSENAVCFEGKSGPYDPTTDKDFAPWAPSEADSSRSEYLNQLKKLF